MNYKIVAERAFRIFSGGNPSVDSGIRKKEFQLAVSTARSNKILYDYYNTSRIEGERTINPAWLVPYEDVPVLFNEKTQSYYSELPSQVIGLPRGVGLYLICPMQNFQDPFKPQTIGESWLFMKNPQDNICYNYTQEIVQYTNFNRSIDKVYIQMIPLISDDIPDEFVHEIIEMVLNQFGKNRTVEDKITDSNPNHKEIGQNG